ncbi:hypothetical protein JCM11641_005296 [Rhodosporidiobolus odoratus]
MASTASPIASLTSTLPAPLQVRPSIPQRSLSARSLPTSTTPRISLVLPSASIPQELQYGLSEVAAGSVRENVRVIEGDKAPFTAEGGWIWVVRFVKRVDLAPGAMQIECSQDDFTAVPEGQEFIITVSYSRPIEAYRALGHVLAVSRGLTSFTSAADVPNLPADHVANGSAMDTDGDGVEQVPVEVNSGSQSAQGEIKWSGKVGQQLRRSEQCLFETVGVMIDCSRNGVLRVESVKYLLRFMALSGLNMLQLYCEDTYKIPGESFFGYFRGGYTDSELREIDDYAFSLGIEVIACIQTLGHLGQMLQWPKYAHLRDTAEVLLADSEETYQFIEKVPSFSCLML